MKEKLIMRNRMEEKKKICKIDDRSAIERKDKRKITEASSKKR